jgi:hypothetical protein
MNPKIDALIDALAAFAAAQNPAITETEALTIAAVRLVKRYSAARSVNECRTLEPVIARLTSRYAKLSNVEANARETILTNNQAAIDAAISSANVAE